MKLREHNKKWRKMKLSLCGWLLFKNKTCVYDIKWCRYLLQQIISLRLSLSLASSSDTPILCMSSFTTSVNLLCGLPLFLQPDSFIFEKNASKNNNTTGMVVRLCSATLKYGKELVALTCYSSSHITKNAALTCNAS